MSLHKELIFQDLHLFLSEQSAQKFLYNIYVKNNIPDAERISYINCVPFLAYLEQAKIFIEQSEFSPFCLKPILLFYGFVNGIKACLLTVNPNYPETTSVLAHGASSRKRKKQQYNYLEDEIKIQKNGLFPHFSEKMFLITHLAGEKVKVKSLLYEIPEMENTLSFLEHQPLFLSIYSKANQYEIPANILDYYNMTKERFIHFMDSKSPTLFNWNIDPIRTISFSIKQNKSKYPAELIPLRYDLFNKNYAIQTSFQSISTFSEIMIFYLLLYHLSMIARYEVEWWSELIKTNLSFDYPIIMNFLSVATYKCPFLINQFLFQYK